MFLDIEFNYQKFSCTSTKRDAEVTDKNILSDYKLYSLSREIIIS